MAAAVSELAEPHDEEEEPTPEVLRLYVGGLPPTTDERDLRECLDRAVQGGVSVELMRTAEGRSRGYAFAETESASDAARIIKVHECAHIALSQATSEEPQTQHPPNQHQGIQQYEVAGRTPAHHAGARHLHGPAEARVGGAEGGGGERTASLGGGQGQRRRRGQGRRAGGSAGERRVAPQTPPGASGTSTVSAATEGGPQT